MTAADDVRTDYPHPAEHQPGFGIAGAERFQQREFVGKFRRGRAQTDNAVNFKRRHDFFLTQRPFGIFAGKTAEGFQIFFFQRKAGRHVVSAAFGQQSLFLGRHHQRADVKPRHRSGRPFHFVVFNRHDKRRQPVTFLQFSGYDADHALMPVVPVNESDRIRLRRPFQNFDRLQQDISFYFLSQGIESVQSVGQHCRLKIVGCAKQPAAGGSFADAAAGVDPRPQHEPQMVAGGRLRKRSLVGQGLQSAVLPQGHDFQPLPDEGAVKPEQRHHVANRTQRHQVQPFHQVRRRTVLIKAALSQFAAPILTAGTHSRKHCRRRF